MQIESHNFYFSRAKPFPLLPNMHYHDRWPNTAVSFASLPATNSCTFSHPVFPVASIFVTDLFCPSRLPPLLALPDLQTTSERTTKDCHVIFGRQISEMGRDRHLTRQKKLVELEINNVLFECVKSKYK